MGADDVHNRKIQIHRTYVIAIIEITSIEDQFGFVGQVKPLAKLT